MSAGEDGGESVANGEEGASETCDLDGERHGAYKTVAVVRGHDVALPW